MTGSICPVPILSRASDKNLPEPLAPSTMGAMLDIRLIREKPDFVRSRVATRGGDDAGKIDQVLAVDAERRQTETALQQLNAERKSLSKKIGGMRGRKEATGELEEKVRRMGDDISGLNE